MATLDIGLKRSLLFSARLRFSPQTQAIRETAIDKIIERNLLAIHRLGCLTLEEIRQQTPIGFANGVPTISRPDLRNGLNRLSVAGRVLAEGEGHETRYRLAPEVCQELEAVERRAQDELSRVVAQLFRNANKSVASYEAPFLYCLCLIFSKLGQGYARLLTGLTSQEGLMQGASIERAVKETAARHTAIDAEQFRYAVETFFQDNDISYAQIKWNLAQNFYIAKALGMDQGARLLSEELFKGADFCLDTNIVIDALEPIAAYHQTFRAFSLACQNLGIKLYIADISLEELNNVLDAYYVQLPKAARQVPEATAPKVRDVFYQIYRQHLKANGRVDINEVFANFRASRKTLIEQYGVEIIEGPFVETLRGTPETQNLIKALQKASIAKRGELKRARPVFHDALLLQLVNQIRKDTARDVRIVTRDSVLAGFRPKLEGAPNNPLALSFDAVLQWISPLGIYGTVEDEVAVLFSDALNYQLLPADNFFSVQEFALMADLDQECSTLPAEDVENCIRYLRTEGVSLDTSTPENREKLASAVALFNAQTGRKYKHELSRLEGEVKYERDERNRAVEFERNESERRVAAVRAEEELKLKEKDAETQRLSQELTRLQVERYEETIAKQRLTHLLKSIAVTISIMVMLWWLLYWTTWSGLDWLRSHQNSYGIQFAAAIGIFSLSLAKFSKEWRVTSLVAGFVGALQIIAQILGGPGPNK
jgi:hypothetical protein